MITESFDPKTRPIIGLRDIYGERREPRADVCLITFSEVIAEAILAGRDCRKIAEIGACNGNIPIYAFEQAGRRIAFYLSPIGSAIASECLLEANWLTGAAKFVVFGSSGSLDFEKTAGRFVIPTACYRDEGTSYHYAPPADYIAVKNADAVKAIFEELKVPFVEGKSWTTDAFLRETAGQMAARKAEGCITVEMELAGLQAVCDFEGLALYAFLVTGDVLSEDEYSVGTLADANHNIDKFRLALEIAGKV